MSLKQEDRKFLKEQIGDPLRGLAEVITVFLNNEKNSLDPLKTETLEVKAESVKPNKKRGRKLKDDPDTAGEPGTSN